MDDGPNIPPPHSRNDANPAPEDSTPISIPTAELARQVKVIDNSGNIPIIVDFHNNFLLETFLKASPKFDSNIIIGDICKEMFCHYKSRKDKNLILDEMKDFGKVQVFKPTTEKHSKIQSFLFNEICAKI